MSETSQGEPTQGEATEEKVSGTQTVAGCIVIIIILVAVIGGIVKMCSSSDDDSSSKQSSSGIESRIEGDKAYLSYEVGPYFAAERELLYKEITEKVFYFLKDNPNVRTIDITMVVKCEDNYGNSRAKESHVIVKPEDLVEMRKYAGPTPLEGCMEWSIAFLGYKMCGQID